MSNFPETFPLKGRRIWVTGGNGFLGSHLLPEISAQGGEVIAPTQSDCDLLDPFSARDFIRKHRPHGIIHLAARVGGIGANRKHPGSFFYGNMAMGLHLIEACRTEEVGKLLMLGTVCSYPKFTSVPFREDSIWDGYPEETNAPYGIAKKALLVQLNGYHEEYGTRGIFLIPVNIYGPGDHLDLENNHVIPALIRKFLEAKSLCLPTVTLWGTGTASREFLYVKDAASAIVKAMRYYEGTDPVNLGTGMEISIRDLAHTIKRLTGYEGDLVFDQSYPDGQPRRQLDVTRARERFGWQAGTDLESGLIETINWAASKLASANE